MTTHEEPLPDDATQHRHDRGGDGHERSTGGRRLLLLGMLGITIGAVVWIVVARP